MKFSRSFWVAWATCALLALLSLPRVPFHPDETSFLTMASDWEALWRDPLSLAWQPNQPDTRPNEYRLLNAPLSKLVFGIALALANESVPVVDWEWSETWQTNLAAGAYPAARQLNAGRLASALLTLGAMPFLYLTGRRLGGETSGLAAAVGFGLHPLALLHGRRAMAEGTMFFFIALALWLLLSAERQPGRAGLAAALATLSKFSPAALVPALGLAALWPPAWDGWRPALQRGLRFGLAFALTCAALMPVLWRTPLGGLGAMAAERQGLTQNSIRILNEVAPARVLDTPAKRAVGLLAQVFILPPAVSDVSNYDTALEESNAVYFALLPHRWGRGLAGGALMLGLTLFGGIRAGLVARRASAARRRGLALLALATGLQAAALLLTLPIGYQRYYLPLLPLLALWVGLAFSRAEPPSSAVL